MHHNRRGRAQFEKRSQSAWLSVCGRRLLNRFKTHTAIRAAYAIRRLMPRSATTHAPSSAAAAAVSAAASAAAATHTKDQPAARPVSELRPASLGPCCACERGRCYPHGRPASGRGRSQNRVPPRWGHAVPHWGHAVPVNVASTSSSDILRSSGASSQYAQTRLWSRRFAV